MNPFMNLANGASQIVQGQNPVLPEPMVTPMPQIQVPADSSEQVSQIMAGPAGSALAAKLAGTGRDMEPSKSGKGGMPGGSLFSAFGGG